MSIAHWTTKSQREKRKERKKQKNKKEKSFLSSLAVICLRMLGEEDAVSGKTDVSSIRCWHEAQKEKEGKSAVFSKAFVLLLKTLPDFKTCYTFIHTFIIR